MGLVWVHFQASRRYLLMTSEAWSPKLCFREASHLSRLNFLSTSQVVEVLVLLVSTVELFSWHFSIFLQIKFPLETGNIAYSRHIRISEPQIPRIYWRIRSPTQNLLQPWLHKQRYREHSCQSQCQSCSLIGLFQLGLTRLYNPLSNLGPWSNRLNFLLNIIGTVLMYCPRSLKVGHWLSETL